MYSFLLFSTMRVTGTVLSGITDYLKLYAVFWTRIGSGFKWVTKLKLRNFMFEEFSVELKASPGA
jgi:hypothetical protein